MYALGISVHQGACLCMTSNSEAPHHKAGPMNCLYASVNVCIKCMIKIKFMLNFAYSEIGVLAVVATIRPQSGSFSPAPVIALSTFMKFTLTNREG